MVRASVALHHVGLEVRRVPRWPGDTVLLGEDEVVELAIEDALRRGLATPIDLRIRGGAMPRTTFVRS